MAIERTVLDNGITVVSERVPHLRSATIGVWVTAGSRAEPPPVNGIGHFIEHMLFKGTERRSALALAREIESVGGAMNACTEREYVFFFAKVLAKDFPVAADLLADIYLHSLFDREELDREREVVLEEILMVEDNPEEFLHDYFHASYWAGHPLGLPIQGTRGSVASFTRDRVTAWYGDRFRRRGIVVSVVGNLPHRQVAETFARVLGEISLGDPHVPEPPPAPAHGAFLEPRPLEQVHLCLGAPSVTRTSPLRHAAAVLNAILGGSVCSRLFQEIREKRGLAYSVYSVLSAYADSGILKIGASTTRAKAQALLDVAGEVLEEMAAGRIENDEVAMARELLKGSMILSLESAEYRMSRNAVGEIFRGGAETHEAELARIEAVAPDAVRSLATEHLGRDRFSLAAVGDLPRGPGLSF